MSFSKQFLCLTAETDAMWKRRLILSIWLLLIILLYFFENNTGTRILLAASITLPSVSILCAVISSRTLTLSISVLEKCKKNDVVECSVSTQKSLLGAFVNILVEAENRLTCEKTALNLSVSTLAGKKSFFLSTSHCGTVHISVTDGQVQDWYGLWRSSIDHN